MDRKLYLASLHGRTDEVRQLIAAGADVNAVGESGETPLHPAVDKGHVEVVRVLLSSGANTEIRNKFGDRPIDFLVQYDETEETKALLIKAGSAPQQPAAQVQSEGAPSD
ncbi:ankyrin repeat domain-containing protein [Akkermansiaceae bacterium]|nr:ankyrin repeat domain-containing protein [Akkermansiaceae bacterium]MDB2428781.1 ankyrin repeat domain-containing protein [Akkermansiaceae bacterium]